MNLAIVTYPRSGSTYLAWLLGYSFGTQIDKFHLDKPGELESLNNYDFTLTTVREPIESITSIVTMESIYFMGDQDFDEYMDKTIRSRIKQYEDFYTIAQDKISLHFDYNEINTKRKELVDYISTITDTKLMNSGYVDLVRDQPAKGFLRTSKTAEDYDKVMELVLDYDLSKCLEIHTSCIENVVDL